MASRNLPVNIDTAYADNGSDPSAKTHQQHHDVIHSFVNLFDQAAPSDGQALLWSASVSLWVPGTVSTGGGTGTNNLTLTGTTTFTGPVTFVDGSIAQVDVNGLTAALALLAPKASPTFTGTPVFPADSIAQAMITGLTQSLLNNLIIRWTGSSWPSIPAAAPFGVLMLSTNDPDAPAPAQTAGTGTRALMTGDRWKRHVDAV